jgi:ubiquitin C-terminal hydrolase
MTPVSLRIAALFSPSVEKEARDIVRTIGEIAARIIFSLGLMFFAAVFVPTPLQPIALTIAALGGPFLSGFFFLQEKFFFTHVLEPSVVPSRLDETAPRGIVNHGNNCWLNADLQLFESDPFIRLWLREAEAEERVVCAFQKFFAAYDDAVKTNRAVTMASSQRLRREIGRENLLIHTPENPQFNRQEDAHEGIQFFLNRLPDHQKIHFENRLHYRTDGLPPIEGHPDGIRIRGERSWGVELAIQGDAPDLRRMIEAHCNEAIENEPGVELRGIDGAVRRYPCHRIERRIVQEPPMLRITLKRFSYERGPETWMSRFFSAPPPGCIVKRDASIAIPLQMPLPLANGESPLYRLKAFVCHSGETPNSGHYTAYCRRGEQWYWANDTLIVPVDRQRVETALASPEPYMVWYEKG